MEAREPYLDKTDCVIGNEDPQKLVAVKSKRRYPPTIHWPKKCVLELQEGLQAPYRSHCLVKTCSSREDSRKRLWPKDDFLIVSFKW